MKKLSLIFALSLLALSSAFAQIGINTDVPDVKATLDIKVNPNVPGGLLIPRMLQTFRRNLSTVGGFGAFIPRSLMLFDTDLKRFCYYDSTSGVDGKWMYLNPFDAYANDDQYGTEKDRVGLGLINQTPKAKLHIKGDTYFEGNTTTTGNSNSNSVSTNTVVVPGFPNNALVPVGVIVMWSGSAASIPANWAICDGSNGTPDLRGRFIVGYDNRGAATPVHSDASYINVGANGGEKTHRLTANESGLRQHTHSASSSTNGDHNHGVYVENPNGGDGTRNALANDATNGSSNTSWSSIRNAGDHSHTITVNDIASSDAIDAHENRPPYYVLVYIIKLP